MLQRTCGCPRGTQDFTSSCRLYLGGIQSVLIPILHMLDVAHRAQKFASGAQYICPFAPVSEWCEYSMICLCFFAR